MDQVKFSYRDMEFLAYAIGENPIGPCKFVNLNLKKSLIQKEGTKFLAPALAINKSIMQLDLSSCKLGVSGTYRIAEALKTNSVLKSLNLYRNIIDVDGARSIGKMLQVNKTLEFLDIGHNRIRQTGLKAICDGILTNPDCKLSKLSICSNFINDDGFTTLFEKLILPSYSGRKQQLTHLYIKKNFMSEYNKISLANKVSEKGVKVFVDDFRAVDYLVKERLEKSIWVSPVEAIETI
jgi:Ran GTPase-activating protein (RanGAP) involved in mRNA processing and transport